MLWDKTGNKVSETILGRYDAIIFYGASTRNKYAIQNLGIQEKVLYFIDSDSSKNGTELDGYMIYSTEKLAQEKNILIMTSYRLPTVIIRSAFFMRQKTMILKMQWLIIKVLCRILKKIQKNINMYIFSQT